MKMRAESNKKVSVFENGPIERPFWGNFIIEGTEHYLTSDGEIVGTRKDIRLIGREITPWQERKGHRLSKQMATGVFEKEIDVLIIGSGIKGDLKVADEVIDEIRAAGVKEVIVRKTLEALPLFATN